MTCTWNYFQYLPCIIIFYDVNKYCLLYMWLLSANFLDFLKRLSSLCQIVSIMFNLIALNGKFYWLFTNFKTLCFIVQIFRILPMLDSSSFVHQVTLDPHQRKCVELEVTLSSLNQLTHRLLSLIMTGKAGHNPDKRFLSKGILQMKFMSRSSHAEEVSSTSSNRDTQWIVDSGKAPERNIIIDGTFNVIFYLRIIFP